MMASFISHRQGEGDALSRSASDHGSKSWRTKYPKIAQQFLHGTDITANLQQVSGDAVARRYIGGGHAGFPPAGV